MTKKKSEVVVSFADSMSTKQVTGSCLLVNDNILIECGGSQGGSTLENYRDNNSNFKFSAKKIEYVFILHLHQDHMLRLPLLIKRGATPKIFVPSGSYEIMYKSLSNSAMLLRGEAKSLSARSKNGKVYTPIYEQIDVENCMEHVYEVDMHINRKLDEEIDFTFVPSGHVPFGASLVLNVFGKKIYYSSDLGNNMFTSYYCENMEVPKNADLAIVESTYADPKSSCKKNDEREKDFERIKAVADQYKKVLIPSFSFARAQSMLTILYELFHEDKSFEHTIVLDSILLNDITEIYKKKFPEFRKIMNWEKIVQIDKKSRDAYLNSSDKVIVISASGSLIGGASILWAQSFLPRKDSCCLIVGYTFEGSLARKIKDGKIKRIKIGEKEYNNNMQVVCLKSMSSHIQHDELIKVAEGINTPKLVLHHGNNEDKEKLKKEIEDRFEKLCKTTRVICPDRKTKIRI